MTAGGPLRAATILSGSSDGDDADGEDAGQLLHGPAYGFFERHSDGHCAGLQILLDQVGDDFGVGLGDELVAFGDQLLLQREVVFDDAVVDDDELAGAVAVGVCVLFRGAAVSGPAGVADAVGAVERLRRMTSSRLRSLPAARRTWRPSPLPATAMPAES